MNKLSIMSWNILSPQIAAKMLYLYKNCKLDNRWPLIIDKIYKQSPDVLFLQELEELQFKELKETMVEYNAHYVQRPGNVDGCATFVKKRIEIVNTRKLNLSKANTFSNRENICMLILAKVDGKKLILANTHILYNPRRGLIKAAQLVYIFEQIYELMQEYSCFDCPIILGGDFNLSPFGLLYQFITKGSLKLDLIPEQFLSGQDTRNSPRTSMSDTGEVPYEITHPFNFSSAYETCQSKNGKAWKFTQDLKGKNGFKGLFVDFIFYGHLRTDAHLYMKQQMLDSAFSPLQFTAKPPTSEYTPESLQLLKIGDLPDPDKETLNSIPDEHIPSDHFPIYAEFK
eukprot:NODE_473_length_8033_cov_0.435216.p3 type:complete len:342 gc:universal NODE_473_length_8033_cov_0.435216:1129-2154(+)